MVGIKGSFRFDKLIVHPEALKFLGDICTLPKNFNGVNNYCPWYYDDDELIWRCNEIYDDDSDISFNDCVSWLEYIINTLVGYDISYVLNGSVVWCKLDNTGEDTEYMRKITVENNLISTQHVLWVNDIKSTKSASKR